MAKIARFNGNVQAFASNQQSGERRVFGATEATESNSLSDQLTPEFLRGWGTVSASEFPPIEWFNALGFTATQFVAYLHQAGIPEWNGEQEYHTGSITNYNGVTYSSSENNNIGQTPSSSDSWINPTLKSIKARFKSVDKMKLLQSTIDGFVKKGDINDKDIVVETDSYYGELTPFLLAENRGSAKYILTTLDRARSLIGDVSWVPDGYRDHYLLGDVTHVALLMLDNSVEINAEQFGASPYASASINDASIASAIKAAKTKSSYIYSCVVTLGRGKFQTEKPIILQPEPGTSQRLVGLKGLGSGVTEIHKTTTETSGVTGHDVDAVVMEVPSDGEDYAYFGDSGGFILTGSIDGVGYGFYAANCPVSKREDIQSNGRENGFYQDDCWMSYLDRIWSINSYDTGISILGGTSVTGRNLYSDRSKVRGFNLRGLQYSNLHCSCDRTAADEATPGIAYDFELAKGLSGQFNVETNHGVEFKFQNSDGIDISGGRSFNSTPVASLTSKVTCSSSTVKFSGFDWTDTIQNLTTEEKANYNLITRDTLSSVDFDSCVFSEDLDERFPRQLDIKFSGNVSSKPYDSNNGITTHSLAINNSSFKRLCYVGNVGRFKIDIAICEDSSVDALYLPLDEQGLYAPSLSTSALSPDDVMQWYQNGSVSIATLQGFVQDGWLFVRPSNAGNNRTYHFKITSTPIF